MKRFILIFALVILSSASYNLLAQVGWSSQTTSYSGNFKDVFFVSTTTGFAVGGNNSTGIVYKTTNGGTSWTSYAIASSSLESVWFTSSTTGYAVGSGGKIYKTTNGGGSWSLLTSGTTTNLKCVQFLNATTGYTIGGTVLLKTTNSGSTWTSTTVPSAGSNTVANGVWFTSTSNGVIYGAYQFINGWINYTSNGGTTWSLPVNTYPGVINDIYFVSSTVGYAVGNAGGIYKTTNGGSSWLMKTSGYTGNLNAVYFVNSNLGYAVGDSGVVLKTVNGGTNWVRQITNIQNSLQGIASPSNTIAYAVGDANKIIKTTSAGVSLILYTPNTNTYCNGYTNLHAYTTYDGTANLSYTWNPSPYLSSTTDSVVTAGPLTADQTFIVTVSDGSLSQTDTTLVTIAPLPTDSICIVAVDSTTDNPVVVFEKHISGPIAYYKIYRESNIAGKYDSIGFLPADSAGVFVDTSANVQIRQYAYKISNVDSCGNESSESAAHKTMHLQVSAGSGGVWNLMWTPYEGVFVQSYEIWRGADTLNMAKIGTVPGTNVSFTDLNPPTGGLYYLVKIVSAYICQPYNYKGTTNYHTSRSNHANNGLIVPPVSADFSASPLSGNKPLNVQFTDASAGLPTTWKWYFGDGNTSTSQNPSHTYNADGKYTVKLVVSSSSSEDSIEKVDYITVGPVGFEDIDLNEHLKIYPNPIQQNSSLFIDYEKVQISRIELVNIIGKNIPLETERTTGHIKLLTNSLSSGIYILKLTSAAGDTLIRKIVIR